MMSVRYFQGLAARRHHVAAVLKIGVALLLVLTLLPTGEASLSAHQANTSLPTLRPNYGGISPDGKRGILLDTVVDGIYTSILLVNGSLVRLLPSGKVVPDLATWKISKNQRVYTFTIRKEARFSDGHAVTAQDAAFSLQRLLMPFSNPGSRLPFLDLIQGATAYAQGTARTLTGVKVVNAGTLQITITKPASYFPAVMWDYSVVYERSVVAGKPVGSPSEDFKTNYLNHTCSANQGAGPFQFVCHDHGSTLHSFYSGHTPKYTLVPNPYYYGRKPHIRLELREFTDGYKAYLAGNADATGIPQPFFNQWKGKSTQYHEFPLSSVNYLTPNVHMAPFDNVHCRLAVAYAIDRDTLYNKVLGGAQRPSYAIVPKGMLGYYSGKDNPHYNLTKARSELARCPGRTTPVDLTVGSGSNPNVGEFMVRGLATAGFNVKLKVLAPGGVFNIVSKPLDQSGTQILFWGWAADYPDPQDFCSLQLRSGQPRNVGGWHNAAFDRRVDRADVTLNRKARAALYIQAQHIALSQGAYISLSNPTGNVLIKPYVHGLLPSELGPEPKNIDWASVSISPH